MSEFFTPENEMGVIVRFTQELDLTNEWELLSIRTEYPDAEVQHAHHKNPLLVEFEYDAKNFTAHNHDPRYCDVIICWIDSGYKGCLPVVSLEDTALNGSLAVLASDTEKELDYWKSQASHYMSMAAKYKKRIELLVDNESSESESLCGCSCGRTFGTKQALAAHKRFCEDTEC